jgi:hypothetical protein
VATISATVIAPELGEVAATALKIRVKYAGISIKAVDSLIAIGMTKVIDVRGTNPAGVVLASIPFAAATMTIVSRDPTIFTVNSSGALVAVKNGSALVVVQFDGLKDSTTVKVRQVTRAMTFPAAVSGELPFGSIGKDRTLAVAATDSLGVAIPTPIVTWTTSDATTITVVAATGVSRALKLGTATITATSDGLVKSILARVTQVPATLTKTAATDAQSATVNTAVPLAPEVTVVDSGGTIMPGVSVTFGVATGGGSVTGGSALSAATGKAAVGSWTLGTTAGPNTLLASAGGASATFTATATFGPANKLGFKVQPTNTATNASIAAIQVAVLDSLGNAVTTGAASTDTVTISLASGTGTLSGGTGTLKAAAVAGVATFSTLSVNAAGSFSLLASSTGLVSATSNSFGVFGAATKLAFITTPATGTAGQALGTTRVAVQDAGGNIVTTGTSATASVTLALASGTGTLSGGTGTLTIAAVGGIATFTTLSINTAGTFTLSGSTAGLTAATSGSITIASVGPAAKLGFTQQPTTVVAGAAIAPSITVAIQDVNGVTNTSSTAAVTLAIQANPGSGTLSPVTGGSLTVNAVGGIATFTGVNINKIATGYTLNASSTGLTGAVSSAFNVTAGAATKVGFIVPPSNAVLSTVMTPAIQVAIQDANGNTVSTSTANVTLAVATGPQGAAIGGTTTVAAVAGVATFSTITASPSAAGYSLTASSPNVTSASSPTFIITASATASIKLGFIVQPTNVASSTNITPSVQVAVQDANGATVSTSGVNVTLALGANANGATASGALSVGTVNGIATFSPVQVALAGTGYTLVAATPAAGLTSATSTAFNVTAGAPAKLAFTVQPTSSVAGTAFAQDVQVAVQDAAGNLVANATNVITLNIGNNPGNSLIRGTTSIAAVNGIATFTGARLTKTGAAYTLQATGPSLSFATSTSFDITAAPASALAFKTQPVNGTAGVVQTSPIQVAVVDSLGNTIIGASDQIALLINSSSPAGSVLTGTTPVTASSGIATFSDARLRTTGFYTLAATAPNLATATSQPFSISAAPAFALAWGVQPATSQIQNAPILGNGSSSLRIDVVDSIGNIVNSNSTASVTIAIGTGIGTLSGTKTLGVSNGSAFFGDLKIAGSGTAYTLSATSTGLTTAASSSFAFSQFGAAAKWAFTTQPSDVLTGVTFSPAVTVALEDQFGNVVANNSSATVSISVQNNAASASANNSTNITLSNGVATFTSMTISGSLDGLVLVAFNGGSFNAALSTPFNVVPANTLAGVYDVAVTGNFAFYIERSGTGSVQKVDLTSGLKTPIATGLNNPGGITTDGTNVWWIEDGAGAPGSTIVKRIPVAGGTIVASATMTNGAGIIQADNVGNVFFIANTVAGTQREIKKLASGFVAGTTPTSFFAAACGTTCIPAFTINGATMYFSNGSNTISSTSTTTFAATSLVTSIASAPVSLAVSPSTIYWNTATSVFSASATTPSTIGTTSATGASSITRLAWDGTSLFALDAGAKTILKYNVSSFASTIAASTLAAPTQAMAMDSFSLFWADNLSPTRLRRTVK